MPVPDSTPHYSIFFLSFQRIAIFWHLVALNCRRALHGTRSEQV